MNTLTFPRFLLHFLYSLFFFSGTVNAQPFPLTVESCGDKLTFTSPPSAAVFHDINTLEMALALGLHRRIAGVSGISGWHRMTPELKKSLGNIPEIAPRSPSLESILAVQPDLFFAGWNYGMGVGGPVTPLSLKKYGIATLVLTESCIHVDKKRPRATMELLYGDFLKLGRIFGKEQEARAKIADWKARLATLPAPSIRSGKNPPRVFLYDSGSDKAVTAGKFAMPTALIEAAGARNLMDDLETSWGYVSWESVAERDPEFLILLDYPNDGGAEKLLKFLETHPLMKHNAAVRQRRFIALRYEELTPGPSNIVAVEKMARALAGH